MSATLTVTAFAAAAVATAAAPSRAQSPATRQDADTGAGAPAGSASGTYTLVRYGGAALPADLGPIPTRDGRSTACRLVITTGELRIDVEAGRFASSTEGRDSCDGRVLSQSGVEGLVAQRGRALAFRVPRRIGTTPIDTVAFTGTFESTGTGTVAGARRGATVTLRPGTADALAFARVAPRPAAGAVGDPAAAPAPAAPDTQPTARRPRPPMRAAPIGLGQMLDASRRCAPGAPASTSAPHPSRRPDPPC